MYVVEFIAPDKPWSINEERTKHRTFRSKLVKLWRETAAEAATEQLDLAPFTDPPEDGNRWKVDIDLPVKGRNRRDPINFIPAVKAINDGLTNIGLWPDDTPNYVEQTVPELIVNGEVVRVLISRTGPPRNG